MKLMYRGRGIGGDGGGAMSFTTFARGFACWHPGSLVPSGRLSTVPRTYKIIATATLTYPTRELGVPPFLISYRPCLEYVLYYFVARFFRIFNRRLV